MNRFGLAREIPEPVKRQVRQRCGFGCVLCGSAFVQYDHLDPPYAHALEHDPAGIVLLCGGCHDRKTRGALSEQTVREASAAPRALQDGFSFGPLDIGGQAPEVQLGELTCTNVERLIVIEGDTIFAVRAPEQQGAPYRISAYLADSAGREILRIVDNEWRASVGSWDIVVKGQTVTLRQRRGVISLLLRTEAPHRVVVERLQMLHRGTDILFKEGEYSYFVTESGAVFEIGNARIDGGSVGVEVSRNGLSIGRGGWVNMGSMRNPTTLNRRRLDLDTQEYRPFFSGATSARPMIRFSPCRCESGKAFAYCCFTKPAVND